jgi:hypothetical protein
MNLKKKMNKLSPKLNYWPQGGKLYVKENCFLTVNVV